MTVEGKYTFGNRVDYRGDDANAMPLSPSDIHGEEEH
jgi:hypothetical protein